MEGLKEELGGGLDGSVLGNSETNPGDVRGQDDAPQATDQLDGSDEADQSADERVDELEEALTAAIRTIEELEKKLVDVERLQTLERLLTEAGVIDLETAMLLAERRLAAGGVSAEEVVQDLAATKGHLFQKVAGGVAGSGIAGSAVSGGPPAVRDSLSDLAEEARRTGDRRAVLRYLRGRRG